MHRFLQLQTVFVAGCFIHNNQAAHVLNGGWIDDGVAHTSKYYSSTHYG